MEDKSLATQDHSRTASLRETEKTFERRGNDEKGKGWEGKHENNNPNGNFKQQKEDSEKMEKE